MAPSPSTGLLLSFLLLSLLCSLGRTQSLCHRYLCASNSSWCHQFQFVFPGCSAIPPSCEFLNQTTLQILRSNLTQLLSGFPQGTAYWTGAISSSQPTTQSACWSQNLSLPASFAPAPPLSDFSGRIITVKKNSTGVSYSYADRAVARKAICEIQSSNANAVSNELCYTEISKCFFVTTNAEAANVHHSNACGFPGIAQMATAKNAAEDLQLRDYLNYLPTDPATEYYINATGCSRPYIFNRTNEVLDMFEYWGDSFSAPRQSTQFACAMINISGLTWQTCPSNPPNYICYTGIGPALSDDMCRGSFCHNFWPLSPGVAFEVAQQKCNNSLPNRNGLVELLREAAFWPSSAPSWSTKYFTGVRKAASSATRSFKWNRTTGGAYENFGSSLTLGPGTETRHCVVATRLSTGIVSFALQDCTSLQPTVVVCTRQAWTNPVVVDPSNTSRTFQDALSRCRQNGSDLANVPVNTTLVTNTAAWLNVFEFQPWQWLDSQSIYETQTADADALAPHLLQSPSVITSQSQCAFVRYNSVNSNATLSLEVGNCTDLASIACQFNSTSCSGVPKYDLGFISGTVSNNLTDSSFSVDTMNGSCPLDLSSPFATQSAVFFTCNNFNTTFLGNDTTMIQSQCSLGSSGPAWTPLINADLCQSNFCDASRIIDFTLSMNVQYLNVTASNGQGVSINRPFVSNGSVITLLCRPGAVIVKADDSFEPGGAISNQVTCTQPSWIYTVATFANSTTIQVCDKTTTDKRLLKCDPIKCNTSDFKFLKSINDRVPRTYLNQNEKINVNCSTNVSAVFNMQPIINIQCIMVADYSYGYNISNTFNGVTFFQVWNNTNTTLDDTISSVCRSAEYPPCTRNQSWFDASSLEIVSLQTTWSGYNTSSLLFPPNSSLTARCIDPRVSDRYWTSIGQTAKLRCQVDKTSNFLQWETTSLACNYFPCPSAEGLLPPMSTATGLKTNLSDTWVGYYNSSKYPPASQIMVNCSFNASVFQILYCNDSGQWVPIQYSYINDTLDLCIGSYINCSVFTTTSTTTTTTTTTTTPTTTTTTITTPTTTTTTTTTPTTTTTTPTTPTTTLVVETTTATPTSTIVDTTTVTSSATTVTVELSSTTSFMTTSSTVGTSTSSSSGASTSSSSGASTSSSSSASTSSSSGASTSSGTGVGTSGTPLATSTGTSVYTTTVSPIPTTTTPYIPLRAFPPVIENRYRINYWATCNHYWQFSDELKSTDQGSSTTFVRDQVIKRRNYFNSACSNSTANPTTIPLDPTCCVACQDEDLLINVPGYSTTDNITNALNRDLPDTVAVDIGLDSTDSKALKLVGSDSTCIRLGFISEDAPYSRACLQQPEKCDYGLSASLWVNFTSDSFLKEVLLSTWSGSTSQGFQFYTDAGKLHLLVVGTKGRWTASIDNFDKKVGRWRLLGFTWERSTGIIQIYIDSVVQIFYYHNTYTEPNAQGNAATLISLGCEISASGSSSRHLRATVIHPAIWLWPIQNENLILLTGALVYKLIRYQAPATTVMPTTAPKPSFAYSSVLREAKFDVTDANPFYTMAHYYIRAVSLQNNVSMNVHNITVTADAQSRNGISLAHFKFTNSPAMFNIDGLSGCIGDFTTCADGISMSVWIGVFETLLSTQMEILRFNIFSISVYNSSGNVMLQVQAGARKITTMIAYQKWINVGCIYDMRGSTATLTLYVNAILRDSTTVDVGSGSTIPDVRKVILGSSTAPIGTLFNDFVVWNRSLEDFEVHKFLGYTLDQLKAIRDATHYWTNDQFVLADGTALAGTPRYNLKSQFRSNVGGIIGSAIKFEDDRHNKSQAMMLDKNMFGQIFLGNEFSSTPTESSIMWFGACITDPFQRPCQIKGLSMHMWINIRAIDATKKQFFFNSGDLGDARSSTLDSRGISLFTTGNLLGVSLSTDRQDWAIVIDSNRYKLNEWFNLGFTWSVQEGMRLFLNGIDYGIKNLHPDISYKAYDKHTRAVVGRFDNDQNTTWLTSREWVMGNFSYSDIVFYERWLSPDEMSHSIGSGNNRFFVNADLFVFGEGIIDTSFILMKQAWLYGVRIGPWGSVSSEQQRFAKISTNGEIGIKAYRANECPRNISACKFQVLFSTWIQILSKDNGTTLNLLSLGNEDGVHEGFGLVIAQDNSLTAWVKRANFKFVTRTNIKVRLNRWLNIGLHLSRIHFHPTIYINGTNASVSLERTTSNAFQANTAASTLKIGLNALGTSPSGSFLVYTVSGWYNSQLPLNQMNTMLGIHSSQYDFMGLADEYWTMSGLWNRLQPRQTEGFNIQNNPDKYDMENGAMCTLGTGGSYISLGSLHDTCLVNSALCKAFILTLNMKPRMPRTPGRAYLFSTGGQNPGHLGMAISVTHDGFIYVTMRSPNKTCEMMVPFNYSDWIQLQVRWYTEAPMAIKVDEEIISRRTGTNDTCWQESNSNTTYTIGHLGKVNSNTTNATATCFSDVMFVYQLVGSGGSLEVDISPTNCYEQQTTYISLNAGEFNYENKANRSQKFVASQTVQMSGTDVCFITSAGCPKGMVMSLWLKIDAISADSEVFNSGFPGSQGIRIVAKMVSGASAYTIAVDSSFNGKTRFIEGNKDTEKVAIGTWVNIGVSVTGDVLEIYQNGISTRATTKSTDDTLALPTGTIVSLGSSTMTMVASDLVFWNDPPLNCLNPNKNRKILTGDCSTATRALRTTCLPHGASTCQTTFENSMCLDPRFDNVVSIDKTGQLFSSKADATTACKVIINTATENGFKAEFIQSSLNILTRISENLAVSEAIDNDTLNSTVRDLSLAFSSVMNPRFSDRFRSLLSDGTVNPASIFSSFEDLALRLANLITTDCSPAIMTAGRMHWSTQRIGPGCSSSAVNSLKYTDSTRAAWASADDEMFLPSSLFAGRSGVKVACVVFDQIDNLVQSVSTNETNFSNMTNSTLDLTVNSRIISIKTSLPAAAVQRLDDPVNITLVLKASNQKQKKDTTLKFETRCAFWDTGVNKWSTRGCVKASEDAISVKCNCYHMTSFAILMQPVPQVQDNIHAKILSILTYVLLSISLLCLLIFIVVIACSKKLRGERYIIHLNLAGALFVAQLAFIFTDIAQSNEGFCKAISIVMHLFFMATFTMLFIEALWVFYAVTKGIIRGRLKWWLPIGWLIPVLIVAVVCGMNINAYGGSRCWINGIFIWSFLGPLVGLGSLTLLVCLIVICNLNEPAIKRKDILNDLRNHTHQCAFLIPFMILAWLFGVILVQWYSTPIEYFFVIFNASQGFWVFLFFGLTNPDFKEVICCRRGRSSVGSSSVSITHGVQDISSSNASFETGSKVAIVPSKTSPKQKGKQSAQPQPAQPQKQPSAPVYHTGKEKKKPQRNDSEDAETTSSQARLKASVRSVRTAASSQSELRGEETDADRPYTPRTEKFTPPGTVD